MSLKLSLDLEKCNGNGLCALQSPTLFGVDDRTGQAVLIVERPDDDQRPDAEAVARVCPTRAIALMRRSDVHDA